MGEAPADGSTPSRISRDRLDTILNVVVAVLVVAVLGIAAWFGYSIWQSRQEAQNATPAHRFVETVKEQVRKDPNNLNLRIELGRAYASVGRFDEANEQLQNALKINKESPEAYYYLGRIAMLEEDNDAAKKYFMQVLTLTDGQKFAELNPRREESLYAMGLISIDEKEYEEAIGYLKGATRIRKDASDTYYQLARAYWGMGEGDAAHEQLDIAYAFDPNYAQALYLNGEIYLAEEDEVNASHWFYLSAQADPDADLPREALASFGTPEERVELGEKALDGGDIEAALTHALVATNIEPDNFDAQVFHAQVLVKRGNTKDAIEVYNKALKLASESEKADIEAKIKALESGSGK